MAPYASNLAAAAIQASAGVQIGCIEVDEAALRNGSSGACRC